MDALLVSIHALLAECDPSARFHAVNRAVSIHALLAECDNLSCSASTLIAGFNPRTPCGVRLISKFPPVMRVQFQSTHSLRSATIAGQRKVNKYKGFNPRTPCGVRHVL